MQSRQDVATPRPAGPVRHLRYDTDREVHAGDWLIAANPDRYWLVLSARLVKPRGPIPRRYRWALQCVPRTGPTEAEPWFPDDFPGSAEEVHSVEFYRRPPRHRWPQR